MIAWQLLVMREMVNLHLIKALYDKELVSSYVNVTGTIKYLNQTIGYLPQFLDEKYLEYTVYDFLIERN